MNLGLFIYAVFELFVLSYLAFLFFKMGQNREKKYVRYRDVLSEKIPIFKYDKFYFALAILTVLMVGLRILERTWYF